MNLEPSPTLRQSTDTLTADAPTKPNWKILGTRVIVTLGAAVLIPYWIGERGWFGHQVENASFFSWFLSWCFVSHLTITAMSLSFHRNHTHKGAVLNRTLDGLFQVWLWMSTTMNKRDWVSVHIYHHAHSDGEKDPHSPVQKGFLRVFLLGAYDYTRAKNHPDVIRLHRQIKENRFEKFLREHDVLGPLLLFFILMSLIGPIQGAIATLSIFLISPLLAVGGVNTLAHSAGYKTYATKDNSRNIGWIFPLNFIICGELDHNNHHAHPKSCSFRHRWYEFDIGFVYLTIFSWVGLAKINHRAPGR
jgi:stearoyl-CoA desaturase (Delta-9 desaturase)